MYRRRKRLAASGTPTERVLALVADETGVPVAKLTLDTRIAHDLGCDGDDAGELFERFADEFGVDLTGLEWHRHFCSEGGGCGCLALPWFLWWYLRGIPFPEADAEPVTIRDLVEAAETKRWVKKLPPKQPAP